MQPLYYLPGIQASQIFSDYKWSESLLKSRDLSETFSDLLVTAEGSTAADVHGNGPDGKSGCILAADLDRPMPHKFGYHAEHQKWDRVNDDLWVCIEDATPDDIRRHKPVRSRYSLKLADGHQWEIPIVRRDDGTSEFPHVCYWDGEGKFTKEIKPSYQSIFDRWSEAVAWVNGQPLSEERGIELAVQALGLNYRYSKIEHRKMLLVDSENWPVILVASCDGSKRD